MSVGSAAGAVFPDWVEWIGRAPHEPLKLGSRPIVPNEDPFYEPPAGFEHARPGTVLRSRDVELGFMGLIPQQVRATQLLYRTTDMNGLPESTVTTVLIPAGHCTTDTRCVVSYQCAIDALSSKCFPSYAMRHRSKALGSLAQLELLMVAAAVAEGWVVSVPDHEGTEGMWGTPCEPGYRVLDGLRATLGYESFGLAPDSKIGLWGYSGGGLASSWAAEMHSEYASELNLVGAVLGSPVGDLGNTFRRLNGTNLSALPAMVVAALAKSYPGLKRVIDEFATTEGLEVLRRLDDMTTGEAVLRMFRVDMDDLVHAPLEEVLSTPEVQHVFEDIKLGRQAPSIPVLIVQAVHDDVISVDDIDGVADAYSAGGTQVTYHRDQFSGHILLHPMSAPMTLRWLTDRFADRPVREHIIRTTWPTLFNPITYLGMARLAGIVGRVVSGGRVPFRPL
jgi:triacylglycerol lipase